MVANGPGAAALGIVDRAAAVAAAKMHLRIAGTSEDALLGAFVESAMGVAEQFIGMALIVREMTATLPASATWQMLPAEPVRAIAAVASGGAPLAASLYAIDIDADARGWVRAPDVVSVTFSAGLAADWAGLPMAVRQGVAVLAAHLYDDRAGKARPPAAVTALWAPFRRMRLTQAVHA
jgi:uncharacterized phiE125 gp8 family phage protein